MSLGTLLSIKGVSGGGIKTMASMDCRKIRNGFLLRFPNAVVSVEGENRNW